MNVKSETPTPQRISVPEGTVLQIYYSGDAHGNKVLMSLPGPLHVRMVLTSPSFCTTASERVYITTSSGNANGGSQGAVGDRRAAICGANAAGAGGL
jgi:hypothetical protein